MLEKLQVNIGNVLIFTEWILWVNLENHADKWQQVCEDSALQTSKVNDLLNAMIIEVKN